MKTSPLPPSKGEFALFSGHISLAERADRLPSRGEREGCRALIHFCQSFLDSFLVFNKPLKSLKQIIQYLFILTVLLPSAGTAQSLPTLLFRQLGSEDGLSAGRTSSMLRDKYGYLWVASENGLTRFDGINCRVYKHDEEDSNSLSGNFCNNIIEDRHGDLWIGTQNALTRYNRQKDKFNSFFLSPAEGAARQYVFPFFIDDKERLWLYLGSRGSVYCYDPATGKLDSVSPMSNGHLFATQPFYTPLKHYISRGVKGIYINYLDGLTSKKTLSCFTYGNNAGQPVTFINQAYQESDSVLWLSSDTGLIRFNPEKNTWRTWNRYAGQQITAQSICPKGDHHFFIGTTGNGLLLFDRQKEHFTGAYTHRPYDPQSIASNTTGYCLTDEDQNLFVATGNQTISYTNLQQVVFEKYIDREEIGFTKIENNITSVIQTGTYTLWCGTQNGGIIEYDWLLRNVIRVYTSAHTSGLHTDQIRQLVRLKNGDILILSRTGYTLYKTGPQKFIPLKQTGYDVLQGQLIVNGIRHLQDGRLIALTEHGLANITIQNNQSIHFDMIEAVNNAVPWSHFSFMHQVNDSTFLLQSYYTNLYVFSNQNIFRFKKDIGSTPFHIYNALTTNDTTWLATSAGLKMLVDIQGTSKILKTGIDIPCFDLIATGTSDIWITTSSGLYRYDYQTGGYTRYTHNEGLQHNIFNPHTMTMLDDSSIIAAGINGFNRFRPLLVRKPFAPFRVEISDILVNDSREGITCNPGLCRQLDLAHDRNTISIHFTSIGFIHPEQHVFWYQLSDYDQAPVKVTGSGSVRYAQLPPGSYEFRLFRDTTDIPVSTLQITISPPVWATWWFRSVVVILVAGAVFILVWLRINSIKQRQLDRVQVMIRSQEEERKRVARDLHDDFGARLSTLKLYMQAARKQQPGNDHRNDLLQQSSDMIDDTITSLRNILLNLSPKTLEENGLRDMLREMADHVNSSGMLQCEVDTAAFPASLRPSTAYALYRICQELVNNTLKYAQAKHIYIALVQRTDLLLFLYEDDGIGFDPERVKRGYGITNIETHVQALKGNLLLDSGTGRGVAVTIELLLYHVNTEL